MESVTCHWSFVIREMEKLPSYATSSENRMTGTVIVRDVLKLFLLEITSASFRPTSALTIFSPHRTHTPAGTFSTTISLPFTQKS
jgi:hypothetical protein